MLVYSKLINKFVSRAHGLAQEILSNEMKLKVGRTRFQYGRYFYPLHIVSFEDSTKLGYFEHSSYRIGLNKTLMFQNDDELLMDTLRHELAHYYCFIKFGSLIDDHGIEFREVCKNFGFSESISKATLKLDHSFHEQSKVFEKIKKLLELASSDHQYEAELATIKANQLILKHNIKIYNENDDLEYFVKVIYKTKRRDAMSSLLYEILELFMVRPVLNYTSNGIELEITGSKENIEIAHYISDFLLQEIPRLWKLAQKADLKLKGIRAKNSYYRGVCKGLKAKLLLGRSEISDSKALVLIEKSLTDATKHIYRGLSTSTSCAQTDSHSIQKGQKDGSSISIRSGIDQSSSSSIKLLK